MRSLLREAWVWFCNLLKNPFYQGFPAASAAHNQTSLRDKAIAAAWKVTSTIDEGNSTVSCPVCLTVIQSQGIGNGNLTMKLAVHLSIWHPDEVVRQWDIMQRKNQPCVHFPSLIVGVGVATTFAALVVISIRNHAQRLPNK